MRPALIPTTLAALAVGTSAVAQDAQTPEIQTPEVQPDWELQRDAESESIFAYVPLTTGLVIAVRCTKGSFDAVIAGLPEARRNDRTRTLRIGLRGEHAHDTRWNVTTDRTVAIADYPAPFARELRAGGAMTITIPNGGGEGRNLRHEIELPPSSSAIDQTLSACDRPLTDPRDALLPQIEDGGLPRGIVWDRAPRPTFPHSAYASGYAVVSCLMTAQGRLDQCVLEAQQPADSAFGRAAMRATADARLTSPAETPGQYTPRIVAFRVHFRGG